MKKNKKLRFWEGVSTGAFIFFLVKLAELTESTNDYLMLLISGAVCFAALKEYSVLRCYREFERKGLFSRNTDDNSRCDSE